MINIQENVLLAGKTTFRIGGPAKYFTEVRSEEELKEALQYGQAKNLECFVMGGGSNILFSDQGFDGLVIQIRDLKFEIQDSVIEAGAGVPLAKLVRESGANGLIGLEWAAGIPGTIGGAVRGNAGAFGKSMADSVSEVRVLELPELKIANYDLKDCNFDYRNSLFKKNKNLIILSAKFNLTKGERDGSVQKSKEIILQRVSMQPKGSSAGSFFMNPVVENEELKKRFEKEKGKEARGGKLPAGWLIEEAGLKGKKIGGAMVSDGHADFLINTGGATAEDVIMLESLVKQQVRDQFGVQLQSEVEHVGF